VVVEGGEEPSDTKKTGDQATDALADLMSKVTLKGGSS